MGRAIVGLTLMAAGALLTLTGIGAFFGIPLAVAGGVIGFWGFLGDGRRDTAPRV